MSKSNPNPILHHLVVAGPAAILAYGFFLLIIVELVLWWSDPILAGHTLLASFAYVLISIWVWTKYPKHASGQAFGLANTITLGRAVLICIFAGFISFPQTVADSGFLIIFIGIFALVLDGVDGRIARRTGTASPFGAHFDMELDGFFILILCILIIEAGRMGWWVLWAGLLRYLYLGAGLLLSRLRQPLVPRKRRQAVAVIQTAALLACLPPLLGPTLETVVLAVTVGLLTLSFATDMIWSLKHDPDRHPINGQRH